MDREVKFLSYILLMLYEVYIYFFTAFVLLKIRHLQIFQYRINFAGQSNLIYILLIPLLLLGIILKIFHTDMATFKKMDHSYSFFYYLGIFISSIIITLEMVKSLYFSIYFSIIFIGLFLLFSIIFKNLLRLITMLFLSKDYFKKKILIVGTEHIATDYLHVSQKYRSIGYEIVGVIKTEDMDNGDLGDYIIGNLESFLSSDKILSIDEVIITIELKHYSLIETIVLKCDNEGVRTKIIPNFGNLAVNLKSSDRDGIPILMLRSFPLDSQLNKVFKRIVDFLFALVAIILASPFMIIIAIGIKLTSPGPIIFKQERVGFNNKMFMMYKFRSMRVQDPNEEAKGWSTKTDNRKTKFGSLLRKTSLDELPQFFNVLFGQMSVVGPRPERPQWVTKFKKEIPNYMKKHFAKPGITGWAQVNGFRGDTSITERIKYDMYYINNWTILFDFKIMMLTVWELFKKDNNAY